MTDQNSVPKFRSRLKGKIRERNFSEVVCTVCGGPFSEPIHDDCLPPKNAVPGSHPLAGNGIREQYFWPPKVRWAKDWGWLNVQDSTDGSWHCIPAKEAPTGYVRLAQIYKQERLA